MQKLSLANIIKVLLGLCVAISIVLLIMYLAIDDSSPFSDSGDKTIIPTNIPLNQQQNAPYAVADFLPDENTNEIRFPVQEITVVFNKPTNSENVKYSVAPFSETRVRQKDQNSIIISPQTIWKPGITTLTIQPQTTSSAGLRLRSSYIYKFNSNFPPDAEIEEDKGYPPQDVIDRLKQQYP